MVEELPVGYYLDNFNYVVDFVANQYSDLLRPEELAYRDRFRALTVNRPPSRPLQRGSRSAS